MSTNGLDQESPQQQVVVVTPNLVRTGRSVVATARRIAVMSGVKVVPPPPVPQLQTKGADGD